MLMGKLLICAGRVGCLALGVMLAVGCASNRGSGGCGGGCGGGCCRGKAAEDRMPPAVPAASAGDVTYLRQPSSVPSSPSAAAVAQAPYGGQKTCPVTGEDLGSMGTPVPVAVKGQTIYVCCQGCAGKVRKDPDAYLAKVMKERQGN